METYSKVTRFCFICNYVSRIIEPLASRCAKFRFRPLGDEVMGARVELICEKENVQMQPGAMSTLSASAVRLAGPSVNRKTLLDVSGQVPEETIARLLSVCRGPRFQEMQKEVQNIIADGYAVQQVLIQLQNLLLDEQACNAAGASDVTDLQKAIMFEILAASDKCLVDGADETLQLLNVASQVQKALHA
eukprot:gene20072-26788_t